ncbi:terminase small subunit [Chloroflexota bacterium]
MLYRYVASGNATQAAIVAGYKPTNARFTASRMLTKANIQQYIAELRGGIKGAQIADIKERKEILTKIIRTPIDPKSIMASHVTQATDIINKMDRVYTEAVPKEGEVYNTFVFVLPDGTRLSPKLQPIIEGEAREMLEDGKAKQENS